MLLPGLIVLTQCSLQNLLLYSPRDFFKIETLIFPNWDSNIPKFNWDFIPKNNDPKFTRPYWHPIKHGYDGPWLG